MKTKKILKPLLTALYVVINLRTHIRMKKKQRNTKKFRDHCHFTGKYRGCAHSICNLNFCNRYFQNTSIFS